MQSLKVLSMPRMLDLLGVVTEMEGQNISEAIVEMTSNRVISEHFDNPASQLANLELKVCRI